jgi:hypothetical protein
VVEAGDADGGTLKDGGLGRLLVVGGCMPHGARRGGAAQTRCAGGGCPLGIGGSRRKVVVPSNSVLDLVRAAAGSASRRHKDRAGGGTCMLVAIDEATPVALGWGLGLWGVGTGRGDSVRPRPTTVGDPSASERDKEAEERLE